MPDTCVTRECRIRRRSIELPWLGKETRVFCTQFDLTDGPFSRLITTGTDDVRFPTTAEWKKNTEWEGECDEPTLQSGGDTSLNSVNRRVKRGPVQRSQIEVSLGQLSRQI